MREMKYTGFMHNYMRMYWGKKILEWSRRPRRSLRHHPGINNKYFLDGRDPNSYAGVAWVYGKHDRAWVRAAVFGKVRYMAASGLERKCDIEAYVHKVENRRESFKGQKPKNGFSVTCVIGCAKVRAGRDRQQTIGRMGPNSSWSGLSFRFATRAVMSISTSPFNGMSRNG
jgi:hypothetical protein